MISFAIRVRGGDGLSRPATSADEADNTQTGLSAYPPPHADQPTGNPHFYSAEGEGFEPSVRLRAQVFETAPEWPGTGLGKPDYRRFRGLLGQ
jgi:hypothetical protein